MYNIAKVTDIIKDATDLLKSWGGISPDRFREEMELRRISARNANTGEYKTVVELLTVLVDIQSANALYPMRPSIEWEITHTVDSSDLIHGLTLSMGLGGDAPLISFTTEILPKHLAIDMVLGGGLGVDIKPRHFIGDESPHAIAQFVHLLMPWADRWRGIVNAMSGGCRMVTLGDTISFSSPYQYIDADGLEAFRLLTLTIRTELISVNCITIGDMRYGDGL